MTTNSGEFATLMQQLREGSQEAARQLLDRYGHHVIRAVRRKLHKSLRSRFDSDDFTQAVWKSFFESRDRFAIAITRPDELVAFLISVANNKVADGRRRFMNTAAHDVKREEPPDGNREALMEQLPSRLPTPSETAVGNELWDRFQADLPIHYQQVVRMRSEGATFVEIAAAVGMDESAVRRILNRLRERFES